MAEEPKNVVVIRDWTGLVSNRGPFAGKPGDATVLKNVRPIAPGLLQVRGGTRKVGWQT